MRLVSALLLGVLSASCHDTIYGYECAWKKDFTLRGTNCWCTGNGGKTYMLDDSKECIGRPGDKL
jgi:hypothetical protein